MDRRLQPQAQADLCGPRGRGGHRDLRRHPPPAGLDAHAPNYEEVYDLSANAMRAKGVVREPKKTTGGAAAGSPAFVRLQDVSKQLEALISRSRGRPNKDLARLADQIKQVMENWEN